MNYFIYNNIKFLYDDISQYSITRDNVSMEIIILSKNNILDIWEYLNQNLNSVCYLYYNYNNFNFILKECYTNNHLLILKGEII